ATCTAEKGTCLGTPYDDSSKCAVPSVQNPPVDKDVELDNVIFRIREGKYDNEGEKAREDCPGKERGANMEFHKSQKQNDVLANLYMDKHADGSQLESGKERDMEWQKNVYALESISGQKKGTSMRENSRSERELIPRDDSSKFDSRSSEFALDHVNRSAVKRVHATNVHKVTTTTRVVTNRGCRPGEDKEVKEGCSRHYEPNCCKCGDCSQAIDMHTSGDKSRKRREPVEKVTDNKVDFNKNNKHILIEDGRDVPAAYTSKYKHRGRTQLDRTEESVGRNDRKRSRSHSPKRRWTDHRDSHPGTNNRHRYESWSHDNSSRNDHDDRWNS
uniref:Uncharacterized protein n=1 Tax=Setaria italica TaxID=4555 RepID=K3YKZ2_SETIT